MALFRYAACVHTSLIESILSLCYLQESRTLEINNVEDGVWIGRTDLSLVVSAADMIEAPAAPVMTSAQPLSQSEREQAAAKL